MNNALCSLSVVTWFFLFPTTCFETEFNTVPKKCEWENLWNHSHCIWRVCMSLLYLCGINVTTVKLPCTQASVYTHQGTGKNSLAKMDLIWNVAATKESKPNETIMRCTILSPYINCHVCVVCTQYSLPLYTLGRFFVLVTKRSKRGCHGDCNVEMVTVRRTNKLPQFVRWMKH